MNYQIKRDGLDFVDDSVSLRQQSWLRETTLKWEGFKIRTRIQRDFYAQQSVIFVEVFDPKALTWNVLQTRSGVDYKNTLAPAQSRDEIVILAKSNDLMNDLIAYAQAVLS